MHIYGIVTLLTGCRKEATTNSGKLSYPVSQAMKQWVVVWYRWGSIIQVDGSNTTNPKWELRFTSKITFGESTTNSIKLVSVFQDKMCAWVNPECWNWSLNCFINPEYEPKSESPVLVVSGVKMARKDVIRDIMSSYQVSRGDPNIKSFHVRGKNLVDITIKYKDSRGKLQKLPIDIIFI